MSDYIRVERQKLPAVDLQVASFRDIVEYFADHHGQYLYGYSQGRLAAVMTAKDFCRIIASQQKVFSDNAVVLSFESEPTSAHLWSSLECRHFPYRAVVIVRGELAFEMVAVRPRRDSRARQRLGLAIAGGQRFQPEVLEWFVEKSIKRVVVVGDDGTFGLLGKMLSPIAVRQVDRFPNKLGSGDALIDCRYFDLVKYVRQDSTVVELCKVVEDVVLSALVSKCKELGVHLQLCRSPDENEISNLTPLEGVQMRSPRNYKDLLDDDVYVNEFAGTDANVAFLHNHPYEDMDLVRKNVVYVQGDVDVIGLRVMDGVRKTLPKIGDGAGRVYMLGACTMFGLCVPDDETIPSLLQRLCIEKSLPLQVENHGCVQGKSFVLNTLLRALALPVRKGDHVVILDSFDRSRGVYDVSEWINADKPRNEHWFFDSVLHCNAKANSCVAKHLLANCMSCFGLSSSDCAIEDFKSK